MTAWKVARHAPLTAPEPDAPVRLEARKGHAPGGGPFPGEELQRCSKTLKIRPFEARLSRPTHHHGLHAAPDLPADGLAPGAEAPPPRLERPRPVEKAPSEPPGPLRPGSEAVGLMRRFNRELGLSPEDEAAKDALAREGPLKLFRVMPAQFHADLAGPYAEAGRLFPRTPPAIPVCGDLHGGNFGAFRGPEGEPVFGINDFDQATEGSPESDLDRLGASAALAGLESGLSEAEVLDLVRSTGRAWVHTVQARAEGEDLEPPFLRHKHAEGPVRKLLEKSAERTARAMLDECCTRPPRLFAPGDEIQPVPLGEAAAVTAAVQDHLRQAGPLPHHLASPVRILDCARKLKSGGSTYGLKRYWLLLETRHGEPLLLELKQLPPSTVHRQDGNLDRADEQDCLRAWKGLGSAPNPLTGALRMDGTGWLVREVEPEKRNSKPEKMDAEQLASHFHQAAKVTGRAHAGTPERARALSRWVGGDGEEGVERLARFSLAYARQVQADFEALRQA